jgi:hypothetical protein
MKTHCKHCHTCGCRLLDCLDGEEWCPVCRQYRRYRSHGWSASYNETSPCPDIPAPDAAEDFTVIADIDPATQTREYIDTWTKGEAP